MLSLNSSLPASIMDNSVYNVQNNSVDDNKAYIINAILIALSLTLPTNVMQNNIFFNQNSLVAYIECSELGTLYSFTTQQSIMKARVMEMFAQENGIPTLVADVTNKMKKFTEVINISHNIQQDLGNVDFCVSVFMPQYNRILMRNLIALEIEAKNAADEYSYMLNFKYIPVIDNPVQNNNE